MQIIKSLEFLLIRVQMFKVLTIYFYHSSLCIKAAQIPQRGSKLTHLIKSIIRLIFKLPSIQLVVMEAAVGAAELWRVSARMIHEVPIMCRSQRSRD